MQTLALYLSHPVLEGFALVGCIACLAMLGFWLLARADRWFEDDDNS